MTPAANPLPVSGVRTSLADACYHALRLAGWLAVTSACVAALWLLFFVLLGNFSFDATVLQLDNFAARYVAAGPARQGAFRQTFWAGCAALFVAVGFFRRHSLMGCTPAANPTSEEFTHA